MCVVSAVSDYYTRQWPLVQPQPFIQVADDETKLLLKRALELLDRVDKKLGDRECNEPAKAKFLNEVGAGHLAASN